MTAARYELFVGERRILAKIAETTEIGRYVLGDDLAEANDPARDALGAILYNLHSAAFVASNFKGDGHTLSATPAGREYLSGGQRG
ncbi:MAG TPA: hypothetical protein VLC46_20415 [Thermoanaerobaculia bacterium]|nr:hypothetical protein [Thermoanaerobaculia bacterium]